MSEHPHTTTLTDDQVHGRACRECGTKDGPLHPDEALVTRAATGVVRHTVTVVCTAHLGNR